MAGPGSDRERERRDGRTHSVLPTKAKKLMSRKDQPQREQEINTKVSMNEIRWVKETVIDEARLSKRKSSPRL